MHVNKVGAQSNTDRKIDTPTNCAHFSTTDIHYFELFDSVKISSYVDRPIQTSYEMVKRDSTTERENLRNSGSNNRKLFSHMTEPDSPLVRCSNHEVWGGSFLYPYTLGYSGPSSATNGYGVPVDQIFDGFDTEYTYSIGVTQGCASLEVNLPGKRKYNTM